MRKYFIIFIVLLLIGAYFYFTRNTDNAPVNIPEQTVEENPSVTVKPQTTSSAGGYKIVWLTVRDKDKIFLYSNLSDKIPSKDIATENSCVDLISGGFYDTEGKHIGLLISEGNTLSESVENNLFNGYFSISKDGIPTITEYPQFSPRISLQTGPFLIKNSKKLELSLKNDENARRLAVGISKNQSVYFFAVYDQSSPLSGPKLSDLPGILEKMNNESGLYLINVINMDGGAHSAFISDLTTLSEISPIGSYFCVKP